MKTLPSPDQLKNKVIIKAKKPKSDSSADHKVVATTNYFFFPNETTKLIQLTQAVDTTLFDLVNICESVPFESFSHSRNKGKVPSKESLR